MKSFDNLRNRTHDILWGAGIAEIATAIYIQEEQLTLVGLGLVVGAELIERKKTSQ